MKRNISVLVVLVILAATLVVLAAPALAREGDTPALTSYWTGSFPEYRPPGIRDSDTRALVRFTSVHLIVLVGTPEGIGSIGAVKIGDKCPVGRVSEEKGGCQE